MCKCPTIQVNDEVNYIENGMIRYGKVEHVGPELVTLSDIGGVQYTMNINRVAKRKTV